MGAFDKMFWGQGNVGNVVDLNLFPLFIRFASAATLAEHSVRDKKAASEMIKRSWWVEVGRGKKAKRQYKPSVPLLPG